MIKKMLLFISALFANSLLAEEIVVYSARNSQLIVPVFEAFTAETGIKVVHTTDGAPALTAKLKAEGSRTPADILVTVDAGNLWQAAEEDVLRSFVSEAMTKAVPAHLRDPDHRWFGLSLRARTLVYDTRKVKPSELLDYRDLAHPKWAGKLCLRTSQKVYNQSLVAMLIAEYGADTAEKVVKGWVSNLATDVFPNDAALIEAIEKGDCAVGMVNTYYLGEELQKNPNLHVGLFWPSEANGGVHINVSGAGITKHAKNVKNAERFMEWLVSPKAQKLFADSNMEFPVVPGIELHPICKAWGPFYASKMPLVKAGQLQAQAVMLMDKSGYK